MLDARLIEQRGRFLIIWLDAANVKRLLRTNVELGVYSSDQSVTLEARRFERLIIELRKIVPAVSGRRVTEVILFSPSGHIADRMGFLLW